MSNDHDELRQRLRSSLNHGVAPDLSPDVVSGAARHPAPRLTNPARTLRIAGASGLAIAAVAVGALVLGPGVVPAPLFTAADGSPDAASLGASDAMTSDSRLMIWVERHYTADASLSTAGGSGPVYQLVLNASDPETRTAELAQALGVDGAVTTAEYSDPAYPTWVVGSQDGSGVNLNYGAFGTGDWWFNDPTVASFYLCDPSVTTVDAERQGCVLPSEAPANQAPTGDTARALAKALFASTGYAASAADIEINSSIDGTSASAYLTIDGVKTGLGWGAYWTNTGDLAYAFGHSVKPEVRGTFNTVSPTDAVKRLDDYRWYGAAGPDYQGGAIMYATGGPVDDGIARVEGPVGTSGSDAEPGVGSESQPTDEPSVPPVDEPTDTATVEPVDPSTPAPEETLPPIEVDPKPEVVEITVDNATATLVLMWDADGNAWLVPGYAMEMPEGWWSAVVSLVDGVIALPDLG
jgi:hypothetical protein